MTTFLTLERTDTGGIQCGHAVDFVPEGDPAIWGIALADAVRHIARGRSQAYGESEWSTIDRVVEVLTNELELQRNDPSRGEVSGGISQ